jgi:hypothetical protein
MEGKARGSVALACALLVAGCGSGSAANPTPVSLTSYHYSPASAGVPACAHSTQAKPLPASFPKAFPFPPGTSINGTAPIRGMTGITGYVPSKSFATTVNFFKKQVPKAGFKLLDFEVDSPHDSEGTYRGHGKTGRWQLVAIEGCHAMRFSASAEPSSKASKSTKG